MVKINFRTKGFKVKDEAPKGHKNATLMGLYICLYTEDPVRLCVCVCVCVCVFMSKNTQKNIVRLQLFSKCEVFHTSFLD